MHRKNDNPHHYNNPLTIKVLMFALLIFFAGKPVLDVCAQVFDFGFDMELCETLEEEDAKEKELDDLEEDKLIDESIEELSYLEGVRSSILDNFNMSSSEFLPGVQTPPPEQSFKA